MRVHAGTGVGCGSADTEADAEKILGAKLLDDITHAIVSGSARGRGDFERTGSDVEVIVDDDDIFGGQFVEVDELTDGRTGSIHKGFWSDEQYFFFADLTHAYLSRHFFVMLECFTAPFFL